MEPQVSVIIPCYNQGHFLKDALDSLQHCDTSLFEIICINDGSTDEFTNNYCKQLQNQGYHVVEQQNMGLSAARNKGIALARGKYILPLDADNKIRPDYITKSIAVLNANTDVAVVYGNAVYFGEQQGIWKQGDFNMQRLMLSNFIDACAVIRKSVLEELNLYDTSMKWGWEDWDLWLRIAFAGYKFHYIDEVLFDYRIVKNSMSKTLYNNYEKPNLIENYVHKKYPAYMGQQWIVDHYIRRFKNNPLLFIGKLFLKSYFPVYYSRLLVKHKIRNGL
jgi:glycosyltransferase involved in cell wall biosynthesis